MTNPQLPNAELGALRAYYARKDWTARDPLWLAACWEATAKEAFSQGNELKARDCLNRAYAAVEHDPEALILIVKYRAPSSTRQDPNEPPNDIPPRTPRPPSWIEKAKKGP